MYTLFLRRKLYSIQNICHYGKIWIEKHCTKIAFFFFFCLQCSRTKIELLGRVAGTLQITTINVITDPDLAVNKTCVHVWRIIATWRKKHTRRLLLWWQHCSRFLFCRNDKIILFKHELNYSYNLFWNASYFERNYR